MYKKREACNTDKFVSITLSGIEINDSFSLILRVYCHS